MAAWRVGLVATTLVTAGLCVPSNASAGLHGDATIRWNQDGMVTRIGPLKTAKESGRYLRLTYRGARRKLGRPSSFHHRYSTCTAYWRKLGIRLLWTSFGVVKKGKCPPFLQGATLMRSKRVKWRTMNGLYIGDSVDQLNAIFPDNYRDEYSSDDEINLVDYPFGWGDGNSPTITAVINPDWTRVRGFRLFIGQAGD